MPGLKRPTLLGSSVREQRSLFGEILDWMLAPLLLMWPMSLALTWLAAQGIASKPYDRALVETVRLVGQRLKPGQDALQVDLPLDSAQLLRADEVDSIYYQVLGADGKLLSGDAEIPPPEFDPTAGNEIRLRDDEVHNDNVRIAYQWVRLAPDEPPALVQVGETMTKRSRLATEIIKGVILPQFVILPIAVLLVWLALARGLAPLHALQQRIRLRASDDLSPIDDREVPEEVTPLVQAINDLLERQQTSLQTQKRFLADAAHQLKTPLAGLRMQAEIAARDVETGQDPRVVRASLEQMANASQRAAHMVNQLLSMARAEAQYPEQSFKPVDLDELARDVMLDFVPRAMDKSQDLGYEGPPADAQGQAAPAVVMGSALLLRELVSNLVGNALHYTPAGGTVTLRVQPIDGTEAERHGERDPERSTERHAERMTEGPGVLLQVEDSGPGIPQAERELVFQPFYRALGTAVDGSGLGLAIVAEIARQHGAQVVLDDARDPAQLLPGASPGARFSLRLAAVGSASPTAAAAA